MTDNTLYDPIAAESPMGFQALLGYGIKEWSTGHCLLDLDVEEHHLNRSLIPHGGLYCTLLDAACGLAGCYCDSEGNVRRCVSVTLTTNFIAVTGRKKLLVTGKVIGGGKSIFFAEAEVLDDEGKLIANASGSYKYHRNSRTPEGEPV